MNHNNHVRLRKLKVRNVNLRLPFSIESFILYHSHDANDLAPRRTETDSLTDGILSRPEAFRGPLVAEHDVRAAGPVAIIKRSTKNQRHSDRCRIAATDESQFRAQRFGTGQLVVALDVKGGCVVANVKRSQRR